MPDDLSRALLRADARTESLAADPARQADRVIRRDRRRLRLLAGLAVALWLVVVLLVVGLVVLFFESVVPKLKQTSDNTGQRIETLLLYVIGLGATLVAVAVGVLALATMATLVLVFAARRATLREVHAGLAAVAGQLDQLRAALTADRPGAGGPASPPVTGAGD